MCNAYNHPEDCTCGFGGEGHLGISLGGFPNTAQTLAIPNRLYENEDMCRATSCPACGASVFFVRHNGGSVWFDYLGLPWPKHDCFPDSNSGVQLRRMLRSSGCFFGVIAQAQSTQASGAKRLTLRCSDGTIFDHEFEFNGDPSALLGFLALVIRDERGSVRIRVLGAAERGRTLCWRIIDDWSNSTAEEYELAETAPMQNHLALLNSRYPNRYYEEQGECGEYWFDLSTFELSNSTPTVSASQVVGAPDRQMRIGMFETYNRDCEVLRPSELDAIEWQRHRDFRQDSFAARLMVLSAMLAQASDSACVECVLEAALLVIDRWDWSEWVANERLRSAFGCLLSSSYRAVSCFNNPRLADLRDVVFRKWLIASAFPRPSSSIERDHYLSGEVCWITVLSLLRRRNLSVAVGRDYELLRRLLLWTGRELTSGTLSSLAREFPSDLWS